MVCCGCAGRIREYAPLVTWCNVLLGHHHLCFPLKMRMLVVESLHSTWAYTVAFCIAHISFLKGCEYSCKVEWYAQWKCSIDIPSYCGQRGNQSRCWSQQGSLVSWAVLHANVSVDSFSLVRTTLFACTWLSCLPWEWQVCLLAQLSVSLQMSLQPWQTFISSLKPLLWHILTADWIQGTVPLQCCCQC